MSVLVIAEYNSNGIAAATRATISAASQVNSDIHVLLAGGDEVGQLADQVATIQSVSKVIKVAGAAYQHHLAENMAPLVAEIAKNYSHVLAPATTFGKDFMPRAAALMDVSQLSDVIAVVDADTFVRPIYAGNALATVKSKDAIKMITVRASSFDKAGDGGSAEVTSYDAKEASGLSSFVSKEETKLDRPELTSAAVVVSGGRGVGSAENFKLIEQLADKLGGAVGASRAAVDAGYVPNDYQVGQTGKIVAPDLYIAVGISGAIQHLAGMKESKVIVAINKDENAPIFEIADYGLVADLFDAVPELEAAL